MERKKILIVDDDVNLCELMQHACSQARAQVILAYDGNAGLKQFFAHRPDLVILDIQMPGMNGWELCRQIKIMSDTPVIMLTTRASDEDIVRGLDLGADDYVTKPFSHEVLLARIRATLRKQAKQQPDRAKLSYRDEYLALNLDERRVTVSGETVRLSDTEFRLLSYLFRNAGRVLTYNQILERIWGLEKEYSDYVHVYVSHLRRKLEVDPRSPRYILTEHRIGYRFEKATVAQT